MKAQKRLTQNKKYLACINQALVLSNLIPDYTRTVIGPKHSCFLREGSLASRIIEQPESRDRGSRGRSWGGVCL